MNRLSLAFAGVLALAGAFVLGSSSSALAQNCSGQPAANTFCAGPASGGPGLPGWRALVTADLSAIAPFTPPNAFPGNGDPFLGASVVSGQVLPYLNENVAWSGNGVFPFQVVATNPYVIGTNATIGSSTVGQIFRLVFTSTHLTGSPITISYVAVGGDTVSTIATKLCLAVHANSTLHNATTSLPLFCEDINQVTPGLFNLQWDVSYSDLTVASTGSTGTITGLAGPTRTLDFAVTILGRRIPGYTGQNGDNVVCFEFMGQSNSGAMDAVASIDCASLTQASTPIIGRRTFSAGTSTVGQMAIENGVVLYGSGGTLPTNGFIGQGTFNVPSTGGYYVNGGAGAALVNGQLTVNNVMGGGATNSVLNLQSTQNGSPSGDFVQITAGSKVGYKFDGTNSTFGAAGSLVGSACFANVTSGTICLKPPTGALGSAVLTLPDITDTLAGLTAPTFVTSITSPIVYGGSAAGSSLALTSTSNGSPSGDSVSIKQGGNALMTLKGGNIGFGTETNPQFPFVYSTNATTGASVAGLNVPGLVALGATTTSIGFNSIAVGGTPQNVFFKVNNTISSPSNIANSDVIGAFTFGGWGNGAAQAGRARILAVATEAWSGTTFGTSFEFDTTPAGGSRAQAMLLKAGVIVGAGTTDPGAGALQASAGITSTGAAAGIGYATGAGCSVTQGTNRTTGVTCTGMAGAITLFSAAGSATPQTFTVTDTSIGANDTVICTQKSGTDIYRCDASAITGSTSFKLSITDLTGTTSEAPVFNFTIIKGATS